jgi:hypothetical protein
MSPIKANTGRDLVVRIGKRLNRRYTALEEYVANAPPEVLADLRRMDRELDEALLNAEKDGAMKFARKF